MSESINQSINQSILYALVL